MSPLRAPRPCHVCHRLNCTQHVKAWAGPTTQQHGYGRTWRQGLRAQVMAEEPNCRACGLPGRSNDVADHIVERKDGGQDVRSNLQRLHHGCHLAKTNRARAQRARVA